MSTLALCSSLEFSGMKGVSAHSKNPFLGLGGKGLVPGENSVYSQVSSLAQGEGV